MQLRTTLSAALCTAALTLAPAAFAQEAEWWTEWDNDEDGLLSDEEFATIYSTSDIFDDTDGDGMASYEEISVGYMSQEEFTSEDMDGDGRLTEDQLMDAIRASWDTNADGMLDAEEMSDRPQPASDT
jgi:hypothetical protein